MLQQLIRSYFLRFILLAGMYLLTGKVGTYWAIPPGYATAVWPASGIALAAVLLWGYRFWPAVWTGSFLLNLGISLDSQQFTDLSRCVLFSAVLSLGPTVQAVAGAWLIRKLFVFPLKLIKGREIFGFLLVSGPGCCLISCTAAVIVLLTAGVIKQDMAFLNWWMWWVGDSIGVIIFSPMVMIFFAEPASIWRKRVLTVALPAGVSFISVVLLFAFMKQLEQEQIGSHFENQSQVMTRALSYEMDQRLDVLNFLRGFIKGSQSVEREEFKAFINNLRNHGHNFAVFAWVPRIKQSEKADFEQRVRREGIGDFKIKTRSWGGSEVKSSLLDGYAPVLYAEPEKENENLLGEDLLSEPPLRQAVELAFKTGELIQSRPVNLSDAARVTYAVLPIFDRQNPAELSPDEKRKHLRGFVMGILRISDIIPMAFKEFETENLAIQIMDRESQEGLIPIYQSGDLSKTTEHFTGSMNRILNKGGRSWKLTIIPTGSYMQGLHIWMVWCILGGGLFLCALLVSFLLMVSGREHIIRQIVDEKTRDLRNLNENLNNEMIKSQRIAQSLDSRNRELEHFNLAAVDREMRIIELKTQVNALSGKRGLPEPYDLSFLDEKKNIL